MREGHGGGNALTKLSHWSMRLRSERGMDSIGGCQRDHARHGYDCAGGDRPSARVRAARSNRGGAAVFVVPAFGHRSFGDMDGASISFSAFLRMTGARIGTDMVRVGRHSGPRESSFALIVCRPGNAKLGVLPWERAWRVAVTRVAGDGDGRPVGWTTHEGVIGAHWMSRAHPPMTTPRGSSSSTRRPAASAFRSRSDEPSLHPAPAGGALRCDRPWTAPSCARSGGPALRSGDGVSFRA